MTPEEIRNRFSLDYNTGALYWKWHNDPRVDLTKEAGYLCSTHGYKFVSIGSTRYRAHRIVWVLITGDWPEEELDHINGVRSDNRPSNLRAANKHENAYNSKIRVDNTSGYRGVSFDNARQKWRAYLSINGKQRYLGRYSSKEEAITAQDTEARKVFGEFYREIK